MDKIKVLIVEDELLIAQDLKAKLQDHNFNVLNIVDSGEEALLILEDDVPDLIIMDIHLAGKLDGIETAAKINEHHDIPIIYLSDHIDAATVERSKNTYPANYLAKPFRTSDVLRALEIAFSNAGKKRMGSISGNKLNDRIFIRTNTQTSVMIPYNDILYIKAGRAYSEIVTNEKHYVLSSSMNNVFDQFNNPNFIRVHRSYVININRVTEIEGNVIKIGNDHKIVMAKNFRNEVLRRINIVK